MNAFSRSWEITKLSFRTVNQDKEMLIFPILSTIFSVAFTVAMLIPQIFLKYFNGTEDIEEISFVAMDYVFMFLTYLGLAFFATFFNMCVVYTAKVRFEGGNATFGQSLGYSLRHIHLVFLWSLLSATVGLLLALLEQIAAKLRGVGQIVVRIIRGIAGLAWNIVTLFVVQAMVYHKLTPGKAMKKSVEVLKRTWGESIIRYFGLGLIQGLVTIILVLSEIAVCALLYFVFHVEIWLVLIIGVVAIVFTIIVISLVFSVANHVYSTALYVYADTGQIPAGYSRDIMQNAFISSPSTRS